jgi:RNA polymerase sigma-70 factor (ECF subfamily)
MSLFRNKICKTQGANAAIDHKIVKRCLDRDEDAWEVIVRALAGRIFSLSYHFTGRREEAEDLTQDIFVRIYQTLGSFHAETGNFSAWALKLSRNFIIDRYRQSRRFLQSGGSEELEAMNLRDENRPGPHRNLEQAETCKVLTDALHTLSPENKEAIILRDLQGMGYQEMAEVLGVPEGTVKSRINRGRLALARVLSRHPALHELCV